MKCELKTYKSFKHLTVDRLYELLKQYEGELTNDRLNTKIGREYMTDCDGWSEPSGLLYVEIGLITDSITPNETEVALEAKEDIKILRHYLDKNN